MNVLELIALAMVVISATAVVLASEPLRQALLLGVLGGALAILFFALQAPDVALSEIVVSTIGLPVMILLTLRKVGEQERDSESEP